MLWAVANTRETLVADYATMAGLLDLRDKNAQDQSEAVAAAKRWLENNSDWLLVLDNADEIKIAEEFIPAGETGHVLLTTRAHAMGAVGESNALEKLTSKEGALFLLRRLRKLKKDEALESTAAEICAQAEALSTLLDGLPLALDQAAAFIEEKPSSLEEYQTFYQSERKELLKRRGKLANDHPSVTITFSLAFKKVADDNPAAADLLRVGAFLEADSIPEEIFIKGAEELGEALGTVARSPLGLSDAIEEAGRYSLLKRHPENRALSLHRLVQAVLRDEMKYEEQQLYSGRAILALNRIFPDSEPVDGQSCDSLIPHVDALKQADYKLDINIQRELAQLLDKAALYLAKRVRTDVSELFIRRALEVICDSNHPAFASSFSKLSEPLSVQLLRHTVELSINRAITQKYDEKETGLLNSIKEIKKSAVVFLENADWQQAEPLIDHVVTAYVRLLGPEHPIVVELVIEIICAYLKVGNSNLPASLLDEKLVRHVDHSDVATRLNELALLYYSQGKYAEAEPFCERALAIREKELGAEHPDVGAILNYLANIYRKLGKYGQAELFYQRALTIREKALGAEHPSVAAILNNFALLYTYQGKYAEAEPLYERRLAIREKELGAEHPFVVAILNSLANIYRIQGKYEQAELFYQRALTIREKELGAEHPSVATILNYLANIYRILEKYEQAELFFKRARAIQEKELGAEHPSVETDLEN